jgi:hypothetical protein
MRSEIPYTDSGMHMRQGQQATCLRHTGAAAVHPVSPQHRMQLLLSVRDTECCQLSVAFQSTPEKAGAHACQSATQNAIHMLTPAAMCDLHVALCGWCVALCALAEEL